MTASCWMIGMNHAYGRETRRYMLFALVAGLALLGVESWLFGARLWALGAVGAAASLAVEWLFAKVRRKPATGGAAVHGLMLALLVPSDLPFWMMALAAVVGTLFAQEAFGGLETCVFHPVLIAKTFLLVSYPSHNAACTLTTPEMQEALGPRGAALLAGCLLLALALSVALRPQTALAYLGLAAGACVTLFAVIGLSRVGEVSAWKDCLVGGDFDVRYIFLNDHWLLTAVLFAALPSCLPRHAAGKLAIGFLAGFLGLLIRGFGRYPESMAFAILICNAVAPALDWALTGGKAAGEDGGQGARD